MSFKWPPPKLQRNYILCRLFGLLVSVISLIIMFPLISKKGNLRLRLLDCFFSLFIGYNISFRDLLFENNDSSSCHYYILKVLKQKIIPLQWFSELWGYQNISFVFFVKRMLFLVNFNEFRTQMGDLFKDYVFVCSVIHSFVREYYDWSPQKVCFYFV